MASQASSHKRPFWTRSRRRTAWFYIFISPWILGFLALAVFPLVVGFLTSLTNYDGLTPLDQVKFLGFKNYERALTLDSDVPFSAGRTIVWGLLNIPIYLTVSFILALILNQNVKGRGLFRTIYYLPTVIPAVTAVTVWKIILDQNFGILNAAISLFRPGTAIGWLSDFAMPGMTTIAVWGGLGFGMVIFLAGLQDIPDELVEASRIDGANNLQVFRHIIFPLMTPVLFFQLIMGLIGAFQQLNLPLILTTSGLGQSAVPPRDIYLFMIHAYRQIFNSSRYGYGTALIWMLFTVVVILTAIVFWSSKFWVYTPGSDEEKRA